MGIFRRLSRFFSISIKTVKGLLLKVGFIFFYNAKPADPLLPLQNPPSTSTISTQPFLDQTPSPTSSPTSLYDDEDSEYCDDDFDRVSWHQEENYSSVETDHHHHHHHHVVFRSLACADTSDGMMCAPVFVEENASRNAPHFADDTTLSMNSTEESDDEIEIKSVIVVVEEKWIKHYSSRQRILLVGEGDFSFSACLAVSFASAPNITATSLDSLSFLKKHYLNDAVSNIEKLRSRGSRLMHGIDATTMAHHQLLGQLKFDRIIYNFPYAGLGGLKDLPRQSQLEHHRSLVRQFLENAREMIRENGEIHITHKTNGFHGEWRLMSLARGGGLRLIEAVKFNHLDYPGYNTKCGFRGNKCFHCYPSKTYKFGLYTY